LLLDSVVDTAELSATQHFLSTVCPSSYQKSLSIGSSADAPWQRKSAKQSKLDVNIPELPTLVTGEDQQ